MSTKNEHLFQQAQQLFPGGVNSPVRAFKAVQGTPRFIHSAKGAYLYDVEGREYIDYVGSWGPMILGHAHPFVIEAVSQAIQRGLSFGAPCEQAVQLAKLICRQIPSIGKIRMVNSGTEATMTAIRLARGYTKRNKIVKFEGCYHGHVDSLLVKAGSGALTLGEPSSPGIPIDCTKDTLIAQFNDLASVQQLFNDHGNEIAAIIVEPIAGNMNLLLPEPGFLEGLRQCCDQHQSLLIFDEVMTGFRVSPQGAQGLYPVTPDLTTLGKIIGGGMPVGAVGGRAEIMDHLSPQGSIYQAGTLSANPVAMTAGLATLQQLQQPGVYDQLYKNTQTLVKGLLEKARKGGIPLTANYCCGMFGLVFTDQQNIMTYQQVTAANQTLFKQFFHHMLKSGVYLAPSAFEVGFISLAHNDEHIGKTLQAAEQALTNCCSIL